MEELGRGTQPLTDPLIVGSGVPGQRRGARRKNLDVQPARGADVAEVTTPHWLSPQTPRAGCLRESVSGTRNCGHLAEREGLLTWDIERPRRSFKSQFLATPRPGGRVWRGRLLKGGEEE